MKLIVESPQTLQGKIETNEHNSKDFIVEGVFATIGAKNFNGRVYSREVWEKAVAEYQKHITAPTVNALMEWEHPTNNPDEVNPINSVAKIEKLYIKDNYVMGRAKLLDNEKANILKNIINEGIPLGVSSRGFGDADAFGNVSDFELVTFDCVASPSDYGAYCHKLGDNFKDGVYMKESYERGANGKIIVENKDKKEAMTESKNTINPEAVISFIKDLGKW